MNDDYKKALNILKMTRKATEDNPGKGLSIGEVNRESAQMMNNHHINRDLTKDLVQDLNTFLKEAGANNLDKLDRDDYIHAWAHNLIRTVVSSANASHGDNGFIKNTIDALDDAIRANWSIGIGLNDAKRGRKLARNQEKSEEKIVNPSFA